MSVQVFEQTGQSSTAYSRKLNVTLLGSEWTSSAGGLSTLNRELAIHLSRHPEVQVSLLVPEGACTYEDKKEAHSFGITVVDAKKRPGYEPLDWLSFPPQDLRVDVVVGHGVKLGRQGQVIRDTSRFPSPNPDCKWVQVVHTAPEDLSKYKGYPDPISKGERKHELEVDLCKLADLVVPVGPRLEETYSSYLQRCKRDSFCVIPGLFNREFGDLEQSPNENTEFKVLLCGRGDKEDFELKGYNIAIKAFTDQRLHRKPYHLIFVGVPDGKQGEVRESLLQCGIAEEQLTVRKFVQSRERMKDLLCEVDLAIMPSKSEGFGLVALEALSAGLPILVSSNSGFARALENIPLGKSCIVNSDEPTKWAKAIKNVCGRHRVRIEEISLLRTSYDRSYSWEEQCEKFVEKLWTMVYGSSAGSVTTPRAESLVQQLSSAAASHKGLSGQQTFYDEEKELTGTTHEGKPSGKKSFQKGKKRKISGSTFDLDRHIKLVIGTEELDDEQREAVYDILTSHGTKYVKFHNLSRDVLEQGVAFYEFLENTYKVSLVCVNKSSLEIVMYCPTLQSLEHLWSDYLSGHLNDVAEKLLVTDEIKRKLNLETVRFKTTIEKEKYLMCKKVLMEMSGGIEMAEGEQARTLIKGWPNFEYQLNEYCSSGRKHITILLCGKTGVGKSRLTNALIGLDLAKEGEDLDPETDEVTPYHFTINNVEVTVFDSPGLADATGKEDEYLRKIKEKLTDVDVFIFCTEMNTQRFRSDDINTIEKMSKTFGPQLWEHSVVVLTFANEVHPPPNKKDVTLQEFFDERMRRFKKKIQDVILNAGVGDDVVITVPFVAAGDLSEPDLPGITNWITAFWIATFKRLNGRAKPSFLVASIDRFNLPSIDQEVPSSGHNSGGDGDDKHLAAETNTGQTPSSGHKSGGDGDDKHLMNFKSQSMPKTTKPQRKEADKLKDTLPIDMDEPSATEAVREVVGEVAKSAGKQVGEWILPGSGPVAETVFSWMIKAAKQWISGD